MGKNALSVWTTVLASKTAGLQRVLNRLVLDRKTGRVGQTLHLSLLLTKALVAHSIPDPNHPHSSSSSHLSSFGTKTPIRKPDLSSAATAGATATNTNYYTPYPNTNPNPTGPRPGPSSSSRSTSNPRTRVNPLVSVARRIQPYLDVSPWINRLLSSLFDPLFPLLSPAHAMASYAYTNSTSSSDISTPRSISPSSSIGRSSQSSISSSKRLSISHSRRISAQNPMSSIDITTIEEAMRMANLDTLKGYAQKNYGEVQQYATTEYLTQNQALGYQVLNEPHWNKGKLTPSPSRLPSVPSVTRPSPIRAAPAQTLSTFPSSTPNLISHDYYNSPSSPALFPFLS